jgi:hypothetical protein
LTRTHDAEDQLRRARIFAVRGPDTPELLAVLRAANDEQARPVRSTGVMAQCPVELPAEMTIISVEEWTTYFALHWWYATPEPSTAMDLRLQDGLSWSGVDDAGGTYLGGDFGGGGGNSPRWVATTMMGPALRTDWIRLDLGATNPSGGSDLTIHLSRDPSDTRP